MELQEIIKLRAELNSSLRPSDAPLTATLWDVKLGDQYYDAKLIMRGHFITEDHIKVGLKVTKENKILGSGAKGIKVLDSCELSRPESSAKVEFIANNTFVGKYVPEKQVMAIQNEGARYVLRLKDKASGNTPSKWTVEVA